MIKDYDLKMKIYFYQWSATGFFLLRLQCFIIQNYLRLLMLIYFWLLCWLLCLFFNLFLCNVLIWSSQFLLHILRIFNYFFVEFSSNGCKELFDICIILGTCLVKDSAYLFGKHISFLFSNCSLFVKVTFRASYCDNYFFLSIAFDVFQPPRKALKWMPTVNGVSLVQLSSTKMTA